MDFVLLYDEAARLLKSNGPVDALLFEAQQHLGREAPNHAARLAARGLKLMESVSFEDGLKAYARRIRTTSQQANFVRMCLHAWSLWQETRDKLSAIAAGDRSLTETGSLSESQEIAG